MSRHILIFYFLALSIIIKAQNFQVIYSASDSAIEAGNYTLAVQLLQGTIAHGENSFDKETAMYNICCVYALEGRTDSAFLCIEKYLAFKDRMDIFYDPDFFNLITDKRWAQLFDRLSKTYFTDHPGYNKKKVYQLSIMQIRDQAWYKAVKVAEKKYGKTSVEAKNIWKKKDYLNQLNIDLLYQMSPNGEFPDSKEIGYDKFETLFLIIQHADLKTQEKFLPEIKKLSERNELSKESFALLSDRVLVREGKMQLFGTQVKTDSTGKSIVCPILNEMNVNTRRKEYGMSTLEDYLIHFNISYHLPEK